jgi:signal transduction histidine kinase
MVDNLLGRAPLRAGQNELLGLYGRIAGGMILRVRNVIEVDTIIEAKTIDLRKSEERFRSLYEETVHNIAVKERLFSILAHDLRVPIGSVRGLLDLACDVPGTFESDDWREMLPELRATMDQSYELLDNLLDWVRSQVSGIEVLRTRVALSRLSARPPKYTGDRCATRTYDSPSPARKS